MIRKTIDWNKFKIIKCEYCKDGIATENVGGQTQTFPCPCCGMVGWRIVHKESIVV